VSQRQLTAVCLWILAWYCAGLIPVAWFAARGGKRAAARAGLAIGLAGAAGLALTGAALW
jgi:hypothetical protein